MAKENYVAKFDNVECIVKFVNTPKDAKHGYSYALNVQNPAQEILPYLTQDNYRSIKMFTQDKQPRFAVNQKITLMQMGITTYGEGKFSAHSIQPDVFQETKPTPPTVKPQPPTPTPQHPPTDKTEKMWADKEERDFRGRAIMYALSTLPPRSAKDTRTSL